MGRLRVVLSWAFVRGPAAAYELADSGSSLFGIGGVLVLVVVAALGSGIGALVGLIAHRPVGDAVFVGGMIGIGAVMAYLVLMLVVVAVLWIRGLSPSDAASGEKLPGRHAARGYGWRRPGEPLVPGSLVLFFALMTLAFGSLGVHARQVSRPWDGPTATTNGTVVAVHEPAWFEKGSGTVDIRYTVAGVEHVIETGRDPGEHEPAKARSTWAVESARSDATFWLWLGGGCGVLGLLSGVGYLGGRLRSSGRRGG
jgi:hypothetical protein